MLVNKPALLGILISVVVLILSNNNHLANAAFSSSSDQTSSSNNNVETGKSNNNNNNNRQKPSSSLASFTNREFVYGEDDDESEPSAAAASSSSSSSSSSSLSSSSSSIAKEQEKLVKQLLDSEDMNSMNSKPQQQQQEQQQQHHKIKKSNMYKDEYVDEASNGGEDEMDSDFRKVESEIAKLRKQRIDQIFKHDKVTQDQVREFHRQADLQKKLLHKQNDRFDFDYEQMLLDQLLNNNENKDAQASFEVANNDPAFTLDDYLTLDDDLEDEMKPNELSSSNNNKQQQQQNNLLKQSDMDNKEQLFSDKPVVKTFKYNQKALSQSEYNSLLKNAKGSSNKIADDQSNNKLLDSQSMVVESNPSGIQKNLNHQHIGDNISDKIEQIRQQNDWLFIVVVAGCIIAGVVAIVAAGVCWFTVHKNSRSAVNIEYGLKSSGSVKSTSSGDRRLAQSAQMYHYQHQKQQMIAMEKANNDTKPDNSDNSDAESEEGDYTVYECPGLAPAGELEVKNPLFSEEFSASSHNIAPPAYSTLSSNTVTPSSTATTVQLNNKLSDISSSSSTDETHSAAAPLVQVDSSALTTPSTATTGEAKVESVDETTTPKQ